MTEEMSVEDALTLQLIEKDKRIAELTARADEMGRMVTLTEKTLVTRSNRIAELTERADDCLRELEQETKRHDEAEDIQQKRIAELERELKIEQATTDSQMPSAHRYLKRIAELEGDLELERERVKQLTVIADGRAKLNTCYRLGTQRGAGAAVDRIRKAEGRLGQLDHDAAEGDTE